LSRKAVFLCLVCLLSLQRTYAAGVAGARYLLTEVGARASAMGGAFAATNDDLSDLGWNPAGIFTLPVWQTSLAHGALFLDNSYDWLAIGGPLSEDDSLAASFFRSGDSSVVHVDQNGNSLGTVDDYDMVGTVAYARRIFKKISLGLSVKGLYSKLYEFQNNGLATDAGVFYKTPVPGIYAGISAQNFGYQTAYVNTADPLPSMIRLALSYDWPLKQNRFTINAEKDYFLVQGEGDRTSAGAEFEWVKLFSVRAGLTNQELVSYTAGFGVVFGLLQLDYAYVPYRLLGDTHRVQVTYYFDEPSKRAVKTPQTRVALLLDPPAFTFTGGITFVPKAEGDLFPKEGEIVINDEVGRVVKRLTFKDEFQPVHWDGRDDQGRLIEANKGYFYQMTVKDAGGKVYLTPTEILPK